jgi:peroxisomal coenzyme A diphosphatase NUDT7
MNFEIEKYFSRDAFEFSDDDIPSFFKRSAVLVLLWMSGQGLKTVVTKRSSRLSKHGGEMCFPGGVLENEETYSQGALREFEEEMGMSAQDINVVGRLDDAWSGAGYHLVPVVGVLEFEPTFYPNGEVAEVLEVPLQGEHDVTSVVQTKNGVEYVDPVVTYDGQKIYGLTADILLEIIELLDGVENCRGKARVESLRRTYA